MKEFMYNKLIIVLKKKQVYAVTGATFTSEAVIKNVQTGLEYYQNNK